MADATTGSGPSSAPAPPSSRSIFAIPSPMRSLFNRFPLHTYASDSLPICSTGSGSIATTTTSRPGSAAADASSTPTLYIFTSPSHPSSAPSPNPTCLKLQTILRAAGISHNCLPSTNHASPTGALPFLILPPPSNSRTAAASSSSSSSSSSSTTSSVIPLTGEKIISHALRNATPSDAITSFADIAAQHPKVEAYRALITQVIRPAWLHDLYLLAENTALLKTLYLPASPLTHPALLHNLRSAATAEILQTTRRPALDMALLHADALAALSSLDALLASSTRNSDEEAEAGAGAGPWFFGARAPSLFDAEVFAYTWPLLEGEGGAMAGLESGLREGLEGMKNLVRHRRMLYERCWAEVEA